MSNAMVGARCDLLRILTNSELYVTRGPVAESLLATGVSNAIGTGLIGKTRDEADDPVLHHRGRCKARLRDRWRGASARFGHLVADPSRAAVAGPRLAALAGHVFQRLHIAAL